MRGFNSILSQSQRLPNDESNFMDLFASEDGSRNNKCMTKNCSSWPSIELNASFQKFNDDDDDTDCTSSSDDSGDTFYESDSSISTFKY